MPISQSSVTSLIIWNKLSEVKPTKYGSYLVTVSFVNSFEEVDTFASIMIFDPYTGLWYDRFADAEDDYPYECGEILYWAQTPKAPIA